MSNLISSHLIPLWKQSPDRGIAIAFFLIGFESVWVLLPTIWGHSLVCPEKRALQLLQRIHGDVVGDHGADTPCSRTVRDTGAARTNGKKVGIKSRTSADLEERQEEVGSVSRQRGVGLRSLRTGGHVRGGYATHNRQDYATQSMSATLTLRTLSSSEHISLWQASISAQRAHLEDGNQAESASLVHRGCSTITQP